MNSPDAANHNLAGKRILVTQSDRFMGPALCSTIADHGAEVISSTDPLESNDAVQQLVDASGRIDVLVANLAIAAPQTLATDVTDEEWQNVFHAMVDPLQWLTRAVLAQMIERKSGKVLLMGSSSAMRGINKTSSYCAARGAQISYIQSVGVEVARHLSLIHI